MTKKWGSKICPPTFKTVAPFLHSEKNATSPSSVNQCLKRNTLLSAVQCVAKGLQRIFFIQKTSKTHENETNCDLLFAVDCVCTRCKLNCGFIELLASRVQIVCNVYNQVEVWSTQRCPTKRHVLFRLVISRQVTWWWVRLLCGPSSAGRISHHTPSVRLFVCPLPC